MENKNKTSRIERRKIEEEKEKIRMQREKELEEKRRELQKIIFNTNIKPENKKPKKESNNKSINIILSLLTVIVIGFTLFLLYISQTKINQLYYIINALFIFVIYITFLIAVKRIIHYKKNKTLIITSVLLTTMITFNILSFTDIIKLPKQSYLPEFENITQAVKWAEKNNINYNQNYEYSDSIIKYGVINQKPKAGTLTKNIKKINFEISNGPDYNKEVIIENMTNWNIDDAVNIIDENYLNNVSVNYTENNDIKKDTIIEQNKYGTVKRNDQIILNVSLGNKENLSEIKLNNLTNETLFKATLYLKRNAIDYELKYEFSKTIEKGKIISQSVTPNNTVKPGDKIVLTVSKGKAIKIPKLKNMKMSEITNWIIKNNLKLKYTDKYDNKIKKGKVISANYKKGDIVEEDTTIEIIISKGKLKMPEFKTLQEFKQWAEKYEIKYEIKEEYNDEKEIDDIIKFSVKTNKTINPNNPIIVYVSKGKAIIVPDFSNKTKNAVTKTCNELGINCTFNTEYSTTVKEGNVISQNIKAGEKIKKGDTIIINIATNNKNKVTKSSNNNNSTNSNKNNTTTKPSNNNQGGNQTKPSCDRTKKITITKQSSLNGSSVSETLKNYQNAYPNIKFTVVTKPSAKGVTGMVHESQPRTIEANYCDTYTLIIIQN